MSRIAVWWESPAQNRWSALVPNNGLFTKDWTSSISVVWKSTFVCHVTICRVVTPTSFHVIVFSARCSVRKEVLHSDNVKWPRLQTRLQRKWAGKIVGCSQVVIRPNTDTKKPSVGRKLTAYGHALETTRLQISHVVRHSSIGTALAAKTACNVKLSNASALVTLIATAYLNTDFAISFYHHAVDNYELAGTAAFGCQIAGFQAHHAYPWTTFSHRFSSSLHRLILRTVPQLISLLALPLLPLFRTLYGSFLLLVFASQETYRRPHIIRRARCDRT